MLSMIGPGELAPSSRLSRLNYPPFFLFFGLISLSMYTKQDVYIVIWFVIHHVSLSFFRDLPVKTGPELLCT